MDGRIKRTQAIIARIQETALHLFTTRGVDQVSMDEIAAAARVSKVTIYKYFHSKDELHAAAVNLYSDQVLAAAEEILDRRDLNFRQKLKLVLMAPVQKPAMASDRHLFDLLHRDAQAEGRLNSRLKDFIFRFFEEGKQQGCIDPSLSFELLYLHSQIYQAGFEARLKEIEAAQVDQEALEAMYNLFFFGFIQCD